MRVFKEQKIKILLFAVIAIALAFIFSIVAYNSMRKLVPKDVVPEKLSKTLELFRRQSEEQESPVLSLKEVRRRPLSMELDSLDVDENKLNEEGPQKTLKAGNLSTAGPEKTELLETLQANPCHKEGNEFFVSSKENSAEFILCIPKAFNFTIDIFGTEEKLLEAIGLLGGADLPIYFTKLNGTAKEANDCDSSCLQEKKMHIIRVSAKAKDIAKYWRLLWDEDIIMLTKNTGPEEEPENELPSEKMHVEPSEPINTKEEEQEKRMQSAMCSSFFLTNDRVEEERNAARNLFHEGHNERACRSFY
ncbi:hypothetical protein NEMIN01_0695 [Nematocida minor]|uniref:uncharacterized protein n=1 Tax=Nematocida minor TaxID=1912983 RepID=UPI00221FC193|nr:uncharacterized protein NEMIN01_0695 [Nematocida minor]KAI5189832.1 hypothetical protein NEMIN01_0695 [Nematocida minor]